MKRKSYLIKVISVFLLSLCAFSSTLSQTYHISGNVSTSKEAVINAEVTFIQVDDSTKKFIMLTDNWGNYQLNIITSVTNTETLLPTKFELAQNYPNPFSNETAITYKLNKPLNVFLKVYDILGREVRTFNIGQQEIGIHGVKWDAKNNSGSKVAPGVYFYCIQTGEEAIVKKMIMINNIGPAIKNITYGKILFPERDQKIAGGLFTIQITNVDLTKPKIEPLELSGIMVARDTTINIEVQQADNLNLYIIERDHLLGAGAFDTTSNKKSWPVDNYHETFVVNNSADTVCFTIESPLPATLKHESVRSPAFGNNAFIPREYSDYFNVPNINREFLKDKPDSSTANSYFWKNIKLGPSDGIHIPYSNYYGEDGRMFIKELGTSHFLNMDIISDYSIKKNTQKPNYIDIEIKETLQNTSNDTIYKIGTILYVPRELVTKFAPPAQSEYTKLYNLISDTVISPGSNKCYLYNNGHMVDGYGFYSAGQDMNPSWFILPPYQSYQFVFKMTIEPLLDKFEIYPTYVINMIIKGDRIWPAGIITINKKIYQGEVHYLKECGMVLPTYFLFSINKDTLRVVSPDDIIPTFKPNY